MVHARLTGRGRLLPGVVLSAIFLMGRVVCAQDAPVLETPQQTNDRIRSLSTGTKAASHDYLIGSGDLLSVSVFDVPELSREVRVNQSGTMSLPLVPVRIQVAGLTELQAEQKIAELLESNGLVTHAEVAVTVKEHRSTPITIVGAVAHPMVYESVRTVTLLEALAEAGGIANDAGDTVIITRGHTATFEEISPVPVTGELAPGTGSIADEPTSTAGSPSPDKGGAAAPGTSTFPSAGEMAQSSSGPPSASSKKAAAPNSMTINLNELLEAGDMRNNIPLQAGDIVTVPHAGIIYVLGAVGRPGGFVVSNDRTQMTTLKILSLAGGLSRYAKVSHAVIVRKDDQGKQTETEVDLKSILDRKSEDLALRASDVLYVPNDRTKEVLAQALQLAIAFGSSVAIYRVAYH